MNWDAQWLTSSHCKYFKTMACKCSAVSLSDWPALRSFSPSKQLHKPQFESTEQCKPVSTNWPWSPEAHKRQFHGLSRSCHSQNSLLDFLFASMCTPQPGQALSRWCSLQLPSYPFLCRGHVGATALPCCSAGSKLWYLLPKSRCRLRKKVQKPTHFWVQLWKTQRLLTAKNEDFSVSNDSTDAFFRAFPQRMGVGSTRTTLGTISDTCVPKYLVNDKMKGFPQRSTILSAK